MSRALEAIPGSRGEVIAGAGHSPHQEKPAEVAALIREFCRGLAMADTPARSGPKPGGPPPAKSEARGSNRPGGCSMPRFP